MMWLKALKEYLPYGVQEHYDQQLALRYAKEFPNILTRNSALIHVVSMAFVLNAKQTKVLMVHHNTFKEWSLPGGHADGCPDLEEVARKEVYEETGLSLIHQPKEKLFAIDILPYSGMMKKDCFVSAHLHVTLTYCFTADDSTPLYVNTDENSEVAWNDINSFVTCTKEQHMQMVYQKLYNHWRGILI